MVVFLVAARALVARHDTADPHLVEVDDATAADAAAHQAGEQEAWAPAVPIGPLVGMSVSVGLHRALARLHLVPQGMVDDAELGNLVEDQGTLWVEPRNPLALRESCARALRCDQEPRRRRKHPCGRHLRNPRRHGNGRRTQHRRRAD